MKFRLVFLLLTVFFVLPPLSHARETLIVTSYGGAYQNFFESQVIPAFSKKYDCDVKLAIGLAKDWLAEMRASGRDKAPYDVIMMNEIWANQIRREGYLAPFEMDTMPNVKDALITFKKDGKVCGVIGAIQPAGIVYRTDKVSNPPKSWKDLWKPEYKGKLGLYTVTNSMGGMFLLTTAKVWFGDEHALSAAIDKIDALKPFKLSEFSGDLEKQITLGEVEIGVIDTPAVARLKKAGVPIGWIEPAEYMFMFEQVFSIHKASAQKDLAAKWIEFILSDEIQSQFVRRFNITPAKKGAVVPEDLKEYIPIGTDKVDRIVVWDWTYFNDNKVKLIREWNRKISR